MHDYHEKKLFQILIKPRYNETDQGGRVYHSNYFVWLDIARTDYLAAHEINYAELEKSGIFIVVKRAECDYITPAEFNELLTIDINHVKCSKVSLEFWYTISHNNKYKAKAYTKLASVDKEGKLCKIPKIIIDKINKSIENA